MPNFDRMAREGTHLAKSFTCQPVCGPARSCLQTGRYATANGCWRNEIPLSPHARTLAHHFGNAGYHTGYIGKWHLADGSCIGPVPRKQRGGYEEWLASNVLEFTSWAYDLTLYDGTGKPVKLPGYRVDAQADAGIRFIDRNKDKPFFLINSFIEPHQQNQDDSFPAPVGYEERYRGCWMPPDLAGLNGSAAQQLPGYYGMVKRLDEALGRTLDALKSLGLEDNTIVLFTSDHGCHFKTRNAEYKRTCHDSSIRTPTAITGPGFKGGGHVSQLTSLIDLPPTLLDAAGIPVPREMQGNSLLPVLRGKPGKWPEEVFIQISERDVARAIRTQKWKYCVSAPDKDPLLNSGSDRYVESFLYDLETDPYEFRNLAGVPSLRKTANELKDRLLRRMKEAGEKTPVIENAASH